MKTRILTMGQALLAFLKNQYVQRDGKETPFFAGAGGIFGHGFVAGFGQALHQDSEFPYVLCRNEQAMVHMATAYAKASNRLRTWACVSSIGPGATNMITGAANAASLGAHAVRVHTVADLETALDDARLQTLTSVIVIEVDKETRVPSYESWWDVPVAEVSGKEAVSTARRNYEKHIKRERFFLQQPRHE